MLVDKTEFEAWMERIIGELYRISRKQDISQDVLQGVGLARVHPQQLRRERDKTAGT